MKQYNKLWVPEKKEGTFAFRDNQGDVPTPIHGSFIVLSLEDLREIWDAAQDRVCALQMGDPRDTKIFESYLESKGIKIINNE